LRDNTTLFLFTFRSEFVKQRPRDTEEEKSIIRSVFADMGWEVPGILERLDDVTDLYFDHISQIQMASWSMGRVALVGDAAACVSLLAGEGTGLAILEAYVLAGELYVAKGDYVIAFRNYEKRLRNLLIQKQKSAAKMLSFFAPKNKMQIALVRIALQTASIPFLLKLFFKRIIQDDIVLPEYKFHGEN